MYDHIHFWFFVSLKILLCNKLVSQAVTSALRDTLYHVAHAVKFFNSADTLLTMQYCGELIHISEVLMSPEQIK